MANAKRPDVVDNALDDASVVHADTPLVNVTELSSSHSAKVVTPEAPVGPPLGVELATVVVASASYVRISKFRVLKAIQLSRLGQLTQYRLNDILSEDNYPPGVIQGLAAVGLELEQVE